VDEHPVDVRSDHEPSQSDRDTADGLRVTWVGLFVNVGLIVIKLWGGFVGRSQALLADAAHSISDLFSDAIVLVGLRWGRKSADFDHPYGHGRIETISCLLVGFLLLVLSLWIGYEAVDKMISGDHVVPRPITIVVAAASVLAKELIYWYTVRVGRRIRSDVVITNAWHHRTDALSSVAVLGGVLIAQINPEWYFADAIAALVVSLVVFRIATNQIGSSFKELADTAPDKDVMLQLHREATAVDGVLQVHALKARHSGPTLLVEMDIVVDGGITVHHGHEIAEAVRNRLLAKVDRISDVMVHVEPESELRPNRRGKN
jgi:cation diffusion facilitator family transporter